MEKLSFQLFEAPPFPKWFSIGAPVLLFFLWIPGTIILNPVMLALKMSAFASGILCMTICFLAAYYIIKRSSETTISGILTIENNEIVLNATENISQDEIALDQIKKITIESDRVEDAWAKHSRPKSVKVIIYLKNKSSVVLYVCNRSTETYVGRPISFLEYLLAIRKFRSGRFNIQTIPRWFNPLIKYDQVVEEDDF